MLGRMMRVVTVFLVALAQPLLGQSTGVIRGTVLLAPDTAAVGARVALRGTTAYHATTDQSGAFRLGPIPAGDYVISAALVGRTTGTAAVTVRAGDTVAVTITLGGPQELPEITVRAARPRAYRSGTASSATKTETPLLETPASLQVVPAQVLLDQRASTITEALEHVSGVRSHNNDLEGYVYKLRGFTSNYLFRDGLPVSFAIPTVHETANLDHLEVLKGPASVLYGRIEPGGVINLVTKKPQTVRAYRLEQELASDDHYRTVGDLTGPLIASGALAYRLTGAWQSSGSYRAFQDQERFFISPQLAWRPRDGTELIGAFAYLDHDAQSDAGFPAIGDRPAPIPLSRSFQEPNDPLDRTSSTSFAYQFRHNLSPGWTIHNRFHAIGADLWKNNVLPISIRPDGSTLDRNVNYQELNGTSYATNLDLAGTLHGLGAEHEILLGYDFLDYYYDYVLANLGADVVTGSSSGHVGNLADFRYSIDLFNPIYGGVPSSAFEDVLSIPADRGWFPAKARQHGVYLQDHLTFGDGLHLVLGGRYDWARATSGASTVSAADARANFTTERDGKFSPRVGVLYQLRPWVSLYTSYSSSFGVNNGRDAQGDPFPPEEGRQLEAGVKTELLDRRLTATAALFSLTKRNQLTADLSTSDPNDAIAIGETRSRGLEVDLLGQITERLGVIANYALTDAEVTRDNFGFEGLTVGNVPRHSGSVFLTWESHPTTAGGVRAGGGVFASSDRQGDAENTFILPGYARVDAFASYTLRAGPANWTAQLNVHNLFDREYFDGTDVFYNSGGRLGIFPGAQRTITATLRAEY